MSGSGLKVLVAGSVASASRQAGAASAVLQFLLGLRSLGHDVWFIDEPPPGSDLADAPTTTEDAAFCKSVMTEAGFGTRYSILSANGREASPLSRERIVEAAGTVDLLLNLSGRLRDVEISQRIPVRVFVDLDPGFNQLWATTGQGSNLDEHTHFATVGWNLGTDACRLPLLGRSWIRMRAPVFLASWPAQAQAPLRGFTTVANWRSYGPIWEGGARLGMKAHSFRALQGLPRLTNVPLEVALDIDPGDDADRTELQRAGWTLLEGRSIASIGDYAAFIRSSTGEIGVAKEGYVITQSGWFSERSAAYLASGRPVVAQATGFEDALPIGAGLIPFTDVVEAAAGIDEITQRYAWHSRHARALAEEYFAADRVLSGLLDEVYASRAAVRN